MIFMARYSMMHVRLLFIAVDSIACKVSSCFAEHRINLVDALCLTQKQPAGYKQKLLMLQDSLQLREMQKPSKKKRSVVPLYGASFSYYILISSKLQ